MRQIVIVATAHQLPVIERLHDQIPDLIVVWHPRRPGSDLPHARHLRDAISSRTDIVLMLTPAGRLEDAVICCREAAVPLYTTGPLPDVKPDPNPGSRPIMGQDHRGGHPGPVWGGDGQWQRLLAARQRAAFGDAVYYRRVGGGGTTGLMSTWWALWDGLCEAHAALGVPVTSARLNVARQTPRRLWHASVHLMGSGGCHAQIAVTPQPDADHVDRMLVGTGGTLSSSAGRAAATLIGHEGIRTPRQIESSPLWHWVCAAIASPPRAHALQVDPVQGMPFDASDLLRALQQATRLNRAITLP